MQLLHLYFEFSVFPYFAFSFASFSVYLYLYLPVLVHFLVSSFHFTSFYHDFDTPDAMTVRLIHLNISLTVNTVQRPYKRGTQYRTMASKPLHLM
jgi:hypothetical protein